MVERSFPGFVVDKGVVLEMRQSILLLLIGVVLPLVSSFITYTLVTLEANATPLGETGGLILSIALLKLMLLATTGIFPVNLNDLFKNILGLKRKKRDDGTSMEYDNSILYQVPEVELMPCTIRFLCELEVAAKTSDNYLPQPPQVMNGRILDEEVAPEEADPLTELQIEAIRALYREEDPTGELSGRGRQALTVLEKLTGPSCEKAYNLCPGRYTIPLVYRTVFDEINLVVHDENDNLQDLTGNQSDEGEDD